MANQEDFKQRKIRELRLSFKVDLLQYEVPIVAFLLIRDDAIAFLLSQFALVYNIWTCSLIKARSAAESIITAFDAVRFPPFPLKRTRESRLFSRFAYIQLINTIDSLKEALAVHRHSGLAEGRADASIPLDIYLEAKGIPLNSPKLRNKLSKYTTIGRRWSELAGPSPFWLALYSDRAETIMCVPILILIFFFNINSQNNSKKIETLGSLATQVRLNCPEVVQILDCLKQNESIARMSGAGLNIYQIEDIITEIKKSRVEGDLDLN
jgi:hypothetical protein